jgi:spore coat protein U-like protein
MKLELWIRAPLAALAIVLAGVTDAYSSGCVVNASSIVFGSYRPLDPGDLVSAGTISYTCTGVRGRVTIALNRGDSNSEGERSMSQGDKRLGYQLYLDPTGSAPWGDGTDGTQVYVASGGASDGTTIRLTVYGKVRSRQDVTAGEYMDMVTVNLTY